MKKNVVDLINIFIESRGESENITWKKILECFQDGVDPFEPYITANGLKQDPAIYFAMQVCNPIILNKLFSYAESKRKEIDLSYHRYDTGRTVDGDVEEKFEWNVLQDAIIYCDLSVVRTLCEYAVKHNKNPFEITKEKIYIGKLESTEVLVQELMVGSLSVEVVNDLDVNEYPSLDEQSRILKKMVGWMTGKDGSIADEFNDEKPLKLKWHGRRDIFEYLIRNNYIDLREATSTSRPFYEWLNIVSKNPKFICRIVKAHSQAMVRSLKVSITTDDRKSFGPVTATGKLPNFVGNFPIPVEVGIELHQVNKLVQTAILAEDEEIKRQQELEMIRAAVPIRRESFEKAKKDIKDVTDTVDNLSEVRINHYNNSKTAEEKTCFNTIYQTILAHMSARKLTSTELLNATPVTINAKIGAMLQATFSLAMSAAAVPGGHAIPEITRIFLNISTQNYANKQSAAVFNTYLVSSVETMLLDLSETITSEIMKLYHKQINTADFGAIASEVAKLTIKNVDKHLINAGIIDEEQFYNFMLKESLASLATKGKQDKVDAFALHTLEANIRNMSSAGLSSTSSRSNEQEQRGRRKKGPGCIVM